MSDFTASADTTISVNQSLRCLKDLMQRPYLFCHSISYCSVCDQIHHKRKWENVRFILSLCVLPVQDEVIIPTIGMVEEQSIQKGDEGQTHPTNRLINLITKQHGDEGLPSYHTSKNSKSSDHQNIRFYISAGKVRCWWNLVSKYSSSVTMVVGG